LGLNKENDAKKYYIDSSGIVVMARGSRRENTE
jgi:hypothetical protein